MCKPYRNRSLLQLLLAGLVTCLREAGGTGVKGQIGTYTTEPSPLFFCRLSVTHSTNKGGVISPPCLFRLWKLREVCEEDNCVFN